MKRFLLASFLVCSSAMAMPIDDVLYPHVDTLWDSEDAIQDFLNPDFAAFDFEIDEQAVTSTLTRVEDSKCTLGSNPASDASSIFSMAGELTKQQLSGSFGAIYREAIMGALGSPGSYEVCTGSYFADSTYEGESTKYVLFRRPGNDMLFSFSKFWY